MSVETPRPGFGLEWSHSLLQDHHFHYLSLRDQDKYFNQVYKNNKT